MGWTTINVIHPILLIFMQNSLFDKISSLNQTIVESLRESDEKNIIRRFAELSIEIMGADFGFVWLNKKTTEDKHLQLAYTSPNIPYQPKIPRPHGSSDTVIKTKKPLLIKNLDQSRYVRRDAQPHLKSLVIIPMLYKDNVYGSFYVCFRNKHTFDKADQNLAEFIGINAGQVITIYLLRKKSEREALKLLKHKDEFFNIVSHELKTPVTTIKGFAQILAQKLQNSDPKTRYFLEKINNQIDKLARLINDLLDVSRIETGKLKFEKENFELHKLVKQTIEGLKMAIPSHPIYFKSGYRFWINGDSARIEEVIINLVTNASKYSPPGSKIKVCLAEKDKKAYLEVEDFGYGISAKDKLKVFNRFFRSKDPQKEKSLGLGLGLYIANSIVKSHGEVLDLKSKKNTNGSIFYFTLPYYKYRSNQHG